MRVITRCSQKSFPIIFLDKGLLKRIPHYAITPDKMRESKKWRKIDLHEFECSSCSMPKYYTHVWTQNNAITMLSSNRKIIIIIINILYSIWKQYKIEIGQFCTEDIIGIRLTQFMCLMFLLKSCNFSVKEPNETSMAFDIREKVHKCNAKTMS